MSVPTEYPINANSAPITGSESDTPNIPSTATVPTISVTAARRTIDDGTGVRNSKKTVSDIMMNAAMRAICAC